MTGNQEDAPISPGELSDVIRPGRSHGLADKAGVLAERVGRFLEAGGARPPKSYRRMAGAMLVWLMDGTNSLAGTCDEMIRGEGITLPCMFVRE